MTSLSCLYTILGLTLVNLGLVALNLKMLTEYWKDKSHSARGHRREMDAKSEHPSR